MSLSVGSFFEECAVMLQILTLTLLYISQLVYFSNRWVNLTKSLIEDAHSARMRAAIDWNTKRVPRKKKVIFWHLGILPGVRL
jgi:hypothetical protein